MSDTVPLIADYGPERVFAWRGDGPVSCASAWRAISALAASLRADQACLNLCEDRYHFSIAFAAIVARGGCNLLPQSRAEGAVEAVRAQHPGCAMLDDDTVAARIAAASSAPPEAPPGIPFECLAALVFTSGSTGPPKPNRKRWGDLQRSTALAEQRLFAGATPVNIVATVPPQHMYGLETSVLTVLLGGDAAHSARPFLPWELRDALQAIAEPRVLVTTPLHLDSCLRSGLAMPAVQRVISATAPLDAAVAGRGEQQWATTVQEIYGCTEAGSLASRRTTAGDIWRLYDGMALTPQGDTMLLSGPQLPEPVPLDDRIERLDEARFRLLGRGTEMIKVAGKRLALNELSARLLAIPGVEDAAVLPPDPEAGRPRPAAAVVAPALSERAIATALAREIDPVFVPRPLLRVPSLPRNEVGKLPRRELAALFDHRDGEEPG